MREMKNSGIEWIGEIPADWQAHRIKVNFQIITGNGFPPQLQGVFGEQYPMCKASDISYAGKNLCTAANSVSEEVVKEQHFNIIPSGSILFAKIGEAMKKNNRAINVIPCCVDNNCQAMVPHNINKDFGYYVFSIIDLNEFDNGGTVPCVNNQKLRDYFIPYPSINEQQHIADYLDRKCSQIDAIIARQQEVIEKLKVYKLSVITEAVTKGLNPDVPMKDSGIEWVGEIPEHWVMIKTRYTVKDIGDIDHYMPESVAVGIPYLMTGDLKDFASEVDFDSCKQVTPDDYLKLSKKIKIEKGDLIFARYATIGTVCLVDVDRDFLVSYSCVIVKVDPNLIDTKFLMYYYKSTAFLEEITKYSNSNTQSNIGKESMYRAKVCVPPLNEQEEIIQYLDKICGSIELLLKSKQAVIDKLTEYKKSLIYEVVTGKKGV